MTVQRLLQDTRLKVLLKPAPAAGNCPTADRSDVEAIAGRSGVAAELLFKRVNGRRGSNASILTDAVVALSSA
jgi:hypothetical protein